MELARAALRVEDEEMPLGLRVLVELAAYRADDAHRVARPLQIDRRRSALPHRVRMTPALVALVAVAVINLRAAERIPHPIEEQVGRALLALGAVNKIIQLRAGARPSHHRPHI